MSRNFELFVFRLFFFFACADKSQIIILWIVKALLTTRKCAERKGGEKDLEKS